MPPTPFPPRSWAKRALNRLIDLQATYDLYINNSTTDVLPEINTIDYNTAVVSHFASGKTVFIQQGDWTYGMISDAMPNAATNIGFVPIPYNNSAPMTEAERIADHDVLPIGVPALLGD